MDKPALMHGFETRSGQEARIDLWQIRSILPVPAHEGSNWVRLVLDNGHSVVVEGTVEWAHRLVVNSTTGSRIPAPNLVVGAGTGEGAIGVLVDGAPTNVSVSAEKVLLDDLILRAAQMTSGGEIYDWLVGVRASLR